MRISQKCSYALRALLELAKGESQVPLATSAIAEAQGISPMFLQTILRELKQGGFVESQRGKEGGYVLARPAGRITVGEVIRFVEGDFAPVECLAGQTRNSCPQILTCPFVDLWKEVNEKVNAIYDSVTFVDLVERERAKQAVSGVHYVI